MLGDRRGRGGQALVPGQLPHTGIRSRGSVLSQRQIWGPPPPRPLTGWGFRQVPSYPEPHFGICALWTVGMPILRVAPRAVRTAGCPSYI